MGRFLCNNCGGRTGRRSHIGYHWYGKCCYQKMKAQWGERKCGNPECILCFPKPKVETLQVKEQAS